MQKNHFLLLQTTHTPILNSFIQRRDLSLEAKGLGSWIGTMPTDIKLTEKYFYEHIGAGGEIVMRTRLVRTAMQELISKNILKKIKVENKSSGNRTIWYLDYNGISAFELLRAIKESYGLDAAIDCAKNHYPHIKIKIESSSPKSVEENTIYFEKDDGDLQKQDVEKNIDSFWDYVARSQKVSNVATYIRKIKNLHAKKRFENYEYWKRNYNNFIKNSIGEENLADFSKSKLMLINKYHAEIASMFESPVVELGGGLKFSLRDFLLNVSDEAINDYFKLLKKIKPKQGGEVKNDD